MSRNDEKGMSGKNTAASSLKMAAKSLWGAAPMLTGVVLLVGLAKALIPNSAYGYFFSHNMLVDSFIGAGVGSVLAGNPVTSYILGGEFLHSGISLVAVTAFIVAWVTVGIVQFPLESSLLGRRFAVLSNVTSFILSIIVAVITVVLVGML